MNRLDWAMLIFRIGAGLVVLAHGINHVRGRAKTTDWFRCIGFRKPEVQWFASTASEIAIGLALIAGLLTNAAAAGLVAVMAVAFWSVHRKNGFFIFRPGEGWEYVAVLALIGASVAIAGPGAASLDHAFGIDDNLAGAVGAALVLGSLGAAGVQLLTFFKPTSD